MTFAKPLDRSRTRRRLLQSAGILGAMAATFPAWADPFVDLDLPGGPDRRDLTTAFPQKGQMILQRTRPLLLETPLEVFDRGVLTPNDQFFVRWHWAVIPWTGIRLRDLLDRAGVKPGAVAVRFNGLDEPVVDGAPDFMKSLDIDHARDGEVMLAYLMNGEQLPLLNGFPLRLIVPGWYSTYWVKMLNDIEVLDAPDENYWMKTAYRIPDTPHASVKPGESGFKTVPINRMVPRSFFTNVRDAATVKPGAAVPIRGIAFGGDCGVSAVELSADSGDSWKKTALGKDEGTYSFRQWSTTVTAPQTGTLALQVRCTNTKGEVQPAEANWNGGGFMRNVIERVQLKVA